MIMSNGLDGTLTNWTGASVEKKNNTQLISTLYIKQTAINKLNKMVALFREEPLLFLITRAYERG